MILVTWRLRGSLLQKPRCASAAAVDRMLDRAMGGPLLLGEAKYAAIVRDSLLRGEREMGLYSLRAWVIQHNHVHVLMHPNIGTVKIAETLMDLSESSACKHFWERESYERLVRNEGECAEALDFIEQHPVRLGLVERAAEWAWSSAFVEPALRIPDLGRLRLPLASPSEPLSVPF